MKFLIFILFYYEYISAIQAQSFSRYEVIVDHFEISKDSTLFDGGTLRARKYNRTTFVMSGYSELLIPFSDDITGQFDFLSYHGNEYRKLYEKKTSKICTFMQNDKIIVPKIITKTSMAPEIKSCPIVPQRIHFYDANMPADFLPLQPPSGEKFRLDVKYFLDGIMVTNASFYILLKKIVEDNRMPAIPKLG